MQICTYPNVRGLSSHFKERKIERGFKFKCFLAAFPTEPFKNLQSLYPSIGVSGQYISSMNGFRDSEIVKYLVRFFHQTSGQTLRVSFARGEVSFVRFPERDRHTFGNGFIYIL